jgi:hypothetical protein
MTPEKTPRPAGRGGAFQEGRETERLKVDLHAGQEHIDAVLDLVDRLG